MSKPHSPSRLFYLTLVALAVCLWLGLRNRPDPLWLEAGALLHERHSLIGEVPDSLQRLYCDMHGLPFRPGDSTAFRLVSRPSLSNIEWTGFRDFCRKAANTKKMVISGVTGVGATKQTKHMARLLAAEPENLLEIDCAPEFDLEYHKKYIGYEEADRFVPGKLLEFWEKCYHNPEQKFVAVVDNFDKINPETFFGPQLWESLSSMNDTAVLGGRKIPVPPNFYLFSVTHLGPGSLVEISQEHFKRIGIQHIIKPSPGELLAWLRLQAEKLSKKTAPDTLDKSRLAALRDTAQMHRFLFYFLKSNQLVRKKYAEGFQLGQGSNIRDLYRAEDLPQLQQVWINHINALHPARTLERSHFDPLDYTVNTQGLERGSNYFSRQIRFLEDTGYLVEVTMVAATALLTALFGWWVFRRREQLIRRYGERAQQVYHGFEKQLISAEVAGRRLEEIKHEVDSLVMRRRLNYTEGLYFLAFIEDKVKRIEFARNVSENFLELFNAFMEDDILTESEYLKLKHFLQSIRHKIPAEVYEQFRDKVEQAYASQKD